MGFPFEDHSTISIIGPSKVGKTFWLYQLLKNKRVMFPTPIEKIIYCYGAFQPMFEQMKNDIDKIIFHEGLLDNLKKFADGLHNLVVLDDLQNDIISNPEALKLFTQGSHHLNLTVIYISHNIYAQGRYSKTINLNTQYLIIFKSFRDAQQIVTLNRQIFPHSGRALIEAYEDAIKTKYGYIVVDLTAHGIDKFRLRTKIFPEETTIIYVPKYIKNL